MGLRLSTAPTALPGVVVVETTTITDARGALTRFFCDRDLAALTSNRRIVQINHSRTAAVGALRGLHYQRPPHAEMKLIRCLKGRVWDVAVDLRAGSETFLRWHAEELSADNGRMLVIPEGCAHGFQVMEPDSELLYLHTAHYTPEAEAGLPWDDPRVGVTWPLPVGELSARDSSHAPLEDSFRGLAV